MSDPHDATNDIEGGDEGVREFVTATIGDQLCGIPVLKVQDVLGPQRITPIPLAPDEVAGSLNLRGRIVTAIDLRARLGLLNRSNGDDEMSIVVEHHGELYSLMVDAVGEVLPARWPGRAGSTGGWLPCFPSSPRRCAPWAPCRMGAS